MDPLQHEEKSQSFAPALALLSLCLFINYVDRGSLSIAAPLLKSELNISAASLGLLLSAFFWTYTAFIFLSGWLVDRFSVNLVLCAGFALWSFATAATGFAQGFASLLLMRLFLGVGESVAFPAISKIFARHLEEGRRGFSNGAITAGMKSGPAFGTLGAGLLIGAYGWRSVFIGIGLLSLLWLPAWIKWMPHGAGRAGALQSVQASVLQIVSHRSFWGAALGHFGCNYMLYFLVTWLPYYLVTERRLDFTEMSWAVSGYYLVDALSCITTGSIADRWLRRGGQLNFVRKSLMGSGCSLAAIAFVGCAFAGGHSYLLWLALLGIGNGMSGSGIYTFAQTLPGPRAAGRWTALQNGFANIAGIIVPALTGFLVDRTGTFLAPLLIASIVGICGALAWSLLVVRVEEIPWVSRTANAA